MNFNASDMEVELTNMVMSSRIKGDFNKRRDLSQYSTFAILEIFYYFYKLENIDPKDYAAQKILAKTLTGRLHYDILEFLYFCADEDCCNNLTFDEFMDPDFKVKEEGE
jgi:hypothetical protein